MQKTNQAGLDLIKSSEGFVNKWYADPAHGWKIPTCCYGHTDMAGEPKYLNTKSKVFTREEGEAILRRDLAVTENFVASVVRVSLTANQFSALVSLAFNIGETNFTSSTLLKKLNALDYAGAALEFPRWNKANGQILAGLVTRRDNEMKLFLRPDDKGLDHPVVIPSAPRPITPPHGWAAVVALLIPLIYGILRSFGAAP